MIMFLDYLLYWAWCLFLYSLVKKATQKRPIKETVLSYDLFGMGAISLIMYMLIYWYGKIGFVLL